MPEKCDLDFISVSRPIDVIDSLHIWMDSSATLNYDHL